jgi:hypothetical protein
LFTLTAIQQDEIDLDRYNDYCFPYVGNGFGWVSVPKNIPDGSLVVTDGLSGCDIIVTDHAGAYNFYHDADGKALQAYGSALIGREVVRIGPAAYDPGDQLHNTLAQFTQKAELRKSPIQGGHFIVAVKHDGHFGLYVSGYRTAGGHIAVVTRNGAACRAILP